MATLFQSINPKLIFMNSILLNQNKPENIKKLQAQRQLYAEGKKIILLQIILTVPVTILLALLKTIPTERIGFSIFYYAALYGIIVAIFDIFCNKVVGNYKTDAAKIQEQFDCDVYDMEWSQIFVGKKVPQETINKYAKKYIPNPKAPLIDWYPTEIGNYSPEKAIYVCQKTNIYYDSALRNKYKWTSIWVSLGILILLLIFSLGADFTVRSFLVQVIFPFLPVLVLTSRIVTDHSRTIKAANDLHQTINNLLGSHSELSMDNLRTIQSKIYCNRKDSPLIPDFFYNKKRQKLEIEMHENAASP